MNALKSWTLLLTPKYNATTLTERYSEEYSRGFNALFTAGILIKAWSFNCLHEIFTMTVKSVQKK